MFEHKTFEAIMQEMLDRVSDDVDKREGAIIYDALAPTALELAEVYAYMDVLVQLSLADTADGEYLTRRVAEHGVFRDGATFAIRKVVITNSAGDPHDAVPVGSLFGLNDITYEITEKVEAGNYKAGSRSAGTIGNSDFGDLIPVEPVEDLGRAELSEVLIPGEDEESDEDLYERFLVHINEQPFGGNRADYKRKVLSISGVGGTRLFRAPSGGGSTKVIIINSDFGVPSIELVSLVQETLDPVVNRGEGYGLAPIGHRVMVEGVSGLGVNVETTLTLNGVSTGQIKPLVVEKLKDYLLTLRKAWGEEETSTVVRISQIEARLIDIQGVEDIQNTKVNGSSDNLSIAEHLIPVLGEVTIYGG